MNEVWFVTWIDKDYKRCQEKFNSYVEARNLHDSIDNFFAKSILPESRMCKNPQPCLAC